MDSKAVFALMSWIGSILTGLMITIYASMGVHIPKPIWILFLILCGINAAMLFSKIGK